MRIKNFAFTALVGATLLLGGCKAPQKVTYFQDDATVFNIVNDNPIRVRPDDKLNILVKSKDAAVADLFNLGIYTTRYGYSGSLTGTGATSYGYKASTQDGIAVYTVDQNGCIDLPIIGKVKIEGMTRSEVAGFIKGELMGRELVKDPTVTVEFANTGINVLGEVSKPGRYDMNVDHMNILEAISLAGDLNILGRRDRVRVIREEDGQTKIYTVDLTKTNELLSSPVYSLRQNDVIYVEPNDMRKRQSTVNGNNALSTSFWISVASLITTAVTTIGVFVK